MGFSSFLCSKSNLSIPAYPYAELPWQASAVVMVLPDNKLIVGIYDGYGRIHPTPNFIAYPDKSNMAQYHEDQAKAVNIWEALKPYLHPDKDEWTQFSSLMKIVRTDHFDIDDKFHHLDASKPCPDQGYFYDEETKVKILSSFPRDLIYQWALSGRI